MSRWRNYLCQEKFSNHLCHLRGQERRDRITDLMILLRAVAAEKIVVWKRLQPGGLTNREASTLKRIRVYEVMAVLRDMGRNRGGWSVPKLHFETVDKHTVRILTISLVNAYVLMVGQ